MDAILAKIKALKDRATQIEGIHRHLPDELFVILRDQFKKDADNASAIFQDLKDFNPQNYDLDPVENGIRKKWALKALICDMNYFINFMSNLKDVQLPALQVSEQGVFIAGQHFDALLKFNEIISKASAEIVLVDGYVNDKVLEILGSKSSEVKCRVLTKALSLSTTLKTFIAAFNKQHGNNLDVRASEAFHDRFVIIDMTDFYHFGASIKDAGSRGFMFSKIEQLSQKTVMRDEFEREWAAEMETPK